MARPERMFPGHIGGELPEEKPAEESAEKTPQEQYEERQEALSKSEDLETRLREEFKQERGQEAPKGVNLSLRMVESFRRLAQEAQDSRKAVRYDKDPKEKKKALSDYTEKKKELDQYLSYGPSFESAYREYVRSQGQYFRFASGRREMCQLQELLQEPAFKDASLTEKLSRKSLARLESVRQEAKSAEKPEVNEALKALETVFAKNSDEYKQAKAELLGETAEAEGKAKKSRTAKERLQDQYPTKRAMQERLQELGQQTKDLWEDQMVRYFWQKRELDKMLDDFSENKDVLETQSVVKILNKLDDWENAHQRTTVGGVLVGPPGVGKTTIVKHYLEEKGRSYIPMDLSEEVTRYMLYGSKAIEFRSQTEYYHQLTSDLEGLDEEGLKQFVAEHHEVVKNTFKVTKGESTAILVEQIVEELEKGEGVVDDPALSEKLNQLKSKMRGLTQKAFRRELAGQFGHLASRNGWRDGVIIAALRRGDSILFDEYNKNRNWNLIHGLMTAKPGEKWHFADNDEDIEIPENWRMYFTANIGAKHGVFPTTEAFSSRSVGKKMEVGYPPRSEEMKVALCALSNPEGDVLRSRDDLAKLFVLVNEVFPRVRKFIEDKNQIVPISYRLLRDLGEKLVQSTDPKTKSPVYAPRKQSFDEAVYEVLVDAYVDREDKTIPREIVAIATSVGLMLDDSVKERVEGWIGKEEFEERKKTFAEHKEDFREIVKKIQGMTRDVSELPMPEQKQF